MEPALTGTLAMFATYALARKIDSIIRERNLGGRLEPGEKGGGLVKPAMPYRKPGDIKAGRAS